MNIRLNLILLAIVAGLFGWYYSLQPDTQSGLDQLIKKEGQPEYTGQKMQTTVYDPKGKPQYFAEATEIKRYESSDRTEFFKPLLNLFDSQTALKQWKVVADHAEISKEKVLTLSGKVKIESLDPTSRLQRIETEKLSVDLTTHDVSTDAVVVSTGLGFTTRGTGLTGNLKKQVATLLKDVKTYIEPTVVKQKPTELDNTELNNKD